MSIWRRGTVKGEEEGAHAPDGEGPEPRHQPAPGAPGRLSSWRMPGGHRRPKSWPPTPPRRGGGADGHAPGLDAGELRPLAARYGRHREPLRAGRLDGNRGGAGRGAPAAG